MIFHQPPPSRRTTGLDPATPERAILYGESTPRRLRRAHSQAIRGRRPHRAARRTRRMPPRRPASSTPRLEPIPRPPPRPRPSHRWGEPPPPRRPATALLLRWGPQTRGAGLHFRRRTCPDNTSSPAPASSPGPKTASTAPSRLPPISRGRSCPPAMTTPRRAPSGSKVRKLGDTLAVHIVSLTPARSYGVSSFSPSFGALVGTDRTAMLGPDYPETTWRYDVDTKRNASPARSPPTANSPGKSPSHHSSAASASPRRMGEVRTTIAPATSAATWTAGKSAPANTVYLGVNMPGGLSHSASWATTRWAKARSWAPPSKATNVEVVVDLIKAGSTPPSRIENGDDVMFVGSGRPLEDAVRVAFKAAVGWVRDQTGLGDLDAYQSPVLEYQVVDHPDRGHGIHGPRQGRQEPHAVPRQHVSAGPPRAYENASVAGCGWYNSSNRATSASESLTDSDPTASSRCCGLVAPMMGDVIDGIAEQPRQRDLRRRHTVVASHLHHPTRSANPIRASSLTP